MNKLLGIIAFSLLVSVNSFAFEFIGKSTVKNVDKCIKNSSTLLDANDTKDRCIAKFQKKIDKDITSGKAYITESNGFLKLAYRFENISKNIVITGYEVFFKHYVGYDGVSGYLYSSQITNADPELVKINYHEWYEPGTSSPEFVLDFYSIEEEKGWYDTSNLSGDVSALKLNKDKIKKGTWSWGNKNIYGLYIK